MGHIKRFPDNVPLEVAQELLRYSKADLLEVAYWLALRLTGHDDQQAALGIIAEERDILRGTVRS